MNKFEQFLLAFAKAAAIAAPAVAPIFIHSRQGVMIFNASEALSSAALEAFTPPNPALQLLSGGTNISGQVGSAGIGSSGAQTGPLPLGLQR